MILAKLSEFSGHPPVNAEHVYNLLQHIYTFPHPYPTLRENTGGTRPIPQSVAASLSGVFGISTYNIAAFYELFKNLINSKKMYVIMNLVGQFTLNKAHIGLLKTQTVPSLFIVEF